MRQISIIFLINFFSLQNLASSGTDRSLLVLFGQESRLERDQEQNITDRRLRVLNVGFEINDFYIISEYGSFEVSTGNASLSVKRTFENYTLWGLYEVVWLKYLNFFTSAGLGLYKETVDTTLLGIKTSDQSNFKNMGGAGLGLRIPAGHFWFSIESRVLFIDAADPNPTVSFLARIGLLLF